VTNFRVIALDDVEAIPVGGRDFNLTWRPVRATLGLRAFGTNAYTAAQAGEDVVEPHTEDSGHQELYLVFRGELACLEAVNGNLDTAREHLARAVELRPEAAEWARTDEDLRALDV